MSATEGPQAVSAEAKNDSAPPASDEQQQMPKVKQEEPFVAKYKVGDKVLATHGPLRYLAKILEIDDAKGYFIHYEGWNSRYDEWAAQDRIFENTDENRKALDQLRMEIMSKVTKRSTSSGNTANSSSKRKRDANADDGEDGGDDEGGDGVTFIKLNLSDDLKTIVVRDWEHLTQHKKLLALPKSDDRTVERIVEDFVNTKKKVLAFTQVCQGLLVYFDRALPTILLYKAERSQYDKLRADFPDKRPCQLYGGEHLLRLFVRLPQLLASTDLDENETKQLCSRLQDLLKFLSKKTHYFGAADGDGYVDDLSSSGTEENGAASTAISEPK